MVTYKAIKKGRECAEYYLSEIQRLRAMKFVSSEKIYAQYLELSMKWLNDKNRSYLTDGFNSYLSDVLYASLEKYKPIPFKDRVKRFVSNFTKIER